MDDSNCDLGDVAYAGKLKTQTFKQLQLERLLKSGAVIPASKLAETKELGFSAFVILRSLLQMRNVIEDLTQLDQEPHHIA